MGPGTHRAWLFLATDDRGLYHWTDGAYSSGTACANHVSRLDLCKNNKASSLIAQPHTDEISPRRRAIIPPGRFDRDEVARKSRQGWQDVLWGRPPLEDATTVFFSQEMVWFITFPMCRRGLPTYLYVDTMPFKHGVCLAISFIYHTLSADQFPVSIPIDLRLDIECVFHGGPRIDNPVLLHSARGYPLPPPSPFHPGR